MPIRESTLVLLFHSPTRLSLCQEGRSLAARNSRTFRIDKLFLSYPTQKLCAWDFAANVFKTFIGKTNKVPHNILKGVNQRDMYKTWNLYNYILPSRLYSFYHAQLNWACNFNCSSSLNGPWREKTCLRRFANNTGADQPAHPRSLISAFVIRFLKRTIFNLATG